MHAAGKIDFDQLAILARKAQTGDSAAYASFLEEIYPFVEMIIRSKLGPVVDVDDVTQVCLLGVHKSLSSYHPSRRIQPWIQAIIRYKIADYFRARARRSEVTLSEQTPDVTTSAAEPNIYAQGRPDDRANIKDLVMRLPDPLRQAVVLTKLNGMSSKEAARKEGISEAALRKRVSRAYSKLATLVDQEWDTETRRGAG